eukprot:UC1_evm1s1766
MDFDLDSSLLATLEAAAAKPRRLSIAESIQNAVAKEKRAGGAAATRQLQRRGAAAPTNNGGGTAKTADAALDKQAKIPNDATGTITNAVSSPRPKPRPVERLRIRQVVESINARACSATAIDVTWQPPSNARAATRYCLQCRLDGNHSTLELAEQTVLAVAAKTSTATVTLDRKKGNPEEWRELYAGDECTHKATGLRPATRYLFRVAALSTFQQAEEASDWVTVTSKTPAAVPTLPPTSVGASHDGFNIDSKSGQPSASVTVQWAPPREVPGSIVGYTVRHRVGLGDGRSASEAPFVEARTASAVHLYNVTGLRRFTAYEFNVSARTQAGEGPASSCVVVVTGEDARRMFLANEPKLPSSENDKDSKTTRVWVRPTQTIAEIEALRVAATAEGAAADLLPAHHYASSSGDGRHGLGVSSSGGTVRRTLARLDRQARQQAAGAWAPEVAEGGAEATKRIDLYMTSSGVVRRTSEECQTLVRIFHNLHVKVSLRDVYLSPKYGAELRARLGLPTETKLLDADAPEPALPQCFIKGRHVGGVRAIQTLNERAQLAKLLEDMPRLDPTKTCKTCGGKSFVVCWWCQGDKQSVRIEFGGKGRIKKDLRCTICEESGLAPCPDCEV